MNIHQVTLKKAKTFLRLEIERFYFFEKLIKYPQGVMIGQIMNGADLTQEHGQEKREKLARQN